MVGSGGSNGGGGGSDGGADSLRSWKCRGVHVVGLAEVGVRYHSFIGIFIVCVLVTLRRYTSHYEQMANIPIFIFSHIFVVGDFDMCVHLCIRKCICRCFLSGCPRGRDVDGPIRARRTGSRAGGRGEGEVRARVRASWYDKCKIT